MVMAMMAATGSDGVDGIGELAVRGLLVCEGVEEAEVENALLSPPKPTWTVRIELVNSIVGRPVVAWVGSCRPSRHEVTRDLGRSAPCIVYCPGTWIRREAGHGDHSSVRK